jgi:predicted RND superfamily exporter protein
MGIPFYTNTTIPFVSSIVIGTIQLGATVDYAILLTTRFREEIRNGFDKIEAMKISLQGTIKSIVTSALTFFGATVGVGIIADMEMVKSLTGMISRGALISLLVIIFMLPSILILFEGVVAKTSRGWRQRTRLR